MRRSRVDCLDTMQGREGSSSSDCILESPQATQSVYSSVMCHGRNLYSLDFLDHQNGATTDVTLLMVQSTYK